MFEDSLMESGGMIRTNQKWSLMISFMVQVSLLVVLVMMPLFYLEALPKQQLLGFLVAPPPPPPPPPPAPPQIEHVKRISEIVNGELRTPSKIPKVIKMIKEDEAPPPNTGVVGGAVGGVAGGTAGGAIAGSIASPPQPPHDAP